MQFTSAFQYAGNQIATSFNVRNIFLHATVDNIPKRFWWCWHPATMQARDSWNTLFIFPLTSVQIMVNQSVTVLKESRHTTKCLDTTGINCRVKCQYISDLRINIHINWYQSTDGIVRNTAPEHESFITSVICFRGLPLQDKFSRLLRQFIPSEVVKCKTDLLSTNPICNFDFKISFVRSIVLYFASILSTRSSNQTQPFTALVCLKYHNES